MKVKEMIEYLQQFNPEADVYSYIEPSLFAWNTRLRENDQVFVYVDDVEEDGDG